MDFLLSAPERRHGRNSLAARIAVTLLLHASLLLPLLLLRQTPPAHGPQGPAMVWIAPQAAAPVTPPPIKTPPPRTARAMPAPNQRSTRPAPPDVQLADAPAPASPAVAAAPITAPANVQYDEFGLPKPGFDRDAARKTARHYATARAGKDDPAVAQFQNPEIRKESELARKIESATRGDCKTAASGAGLLALVAVPLMILTDKKDSGCKW